MHFAACAGLSTAVRQCHRRRGAAQRPAQIYVSSISKVGGLTCRRGIAQIHPDRYRRDSPEYESWQLSRLLNATERRMFLESGNAQAEAKASHETHFRFFLCNAWWPSGKIVGTCISIADTTQKIQIKQVVWVWATCCWIDVLIC